MNTEQIADRLCIIPARGGSKRIPRKNIKPFGGMPLIAHSIETALESNLFDRVIVSTDDNEIAQTVLGYGAEIPFMRSAELANDFATTAEVLLDGILQISEQYEYSQLCCIYPTAPLLQPEDLHKALELLNKHKADSIVSCTEFDFPPLRGFKIEDKGQIQFNWPEYELTRSQDLPELIHDAGCFYWLDTKFLLNEKRLIGKNSFPYMLPRHRAIDIDTPEDFAFAEKLYALECV